MAWPNTPLTSYVANSTPVIKANDLNAFQSAINAVINGTYTVKSLTADGVGGAVLTPTPGNIVATGSVTAFKTSAGAPGAVTLQGEMTQGLVAIGWAVVDINGNLVRGVNVNGAHHSGVGTYWVDFNPLPTDPVNAFAIVQTMGTMCMTQGVCSNTGGRIRVSVYIDDLLTPNPNNAATSIVRQPINAAFGVLLFAE